MEALRHCMNTNMGAAPENETEIDALLLYEIRFDEDADDQSDGGE